MESEEAKEIYAHFGLAFYLSNCLEHSIANALCFLELFPNRKACSQEEWEKLIDAHYIDSFEKTLGQLKKKLLLHKDTFSSLVNIIPELEKCLDERNFIAHHFYIEYATHWFSLKGRSEMIERLEAARELFREVAEKLDAAIKPITKKYGLTDELFEKFFTKIKSEAESY